MRRFVPILALLSLACIFCFSCSSDDKSTDPVDPGDTSAPSIIAAFPASGDTGVSLNIIVSATFSEPLDSNSIHRGILTVGSDSGEFSASLEQIRIVPDNRLKGDSLYQVRVKGTLSDTAGNSLGSDLVWTFRTTASIRGAYDGIYTGILHYDTDSADTMVQPIDFFFGDTTFKLNIDTTRPFNTLFRIGVGEGTFRYSPDTSFFKGAIWGPDTEAGFTSYDPIWDIVGQVESLNRFPQGDSVEFIIHNVIDSVLKRITLGRI